MPKYRNKETVNARKVTAKDGETIVTDAGPQHAPKGAYVVESNGGANTRVQDAESFEAQYAAPAKRKTKGKGKGKG